VADIVDTGELVDTGGNFCMCNDRSKLMNVQPIAPFGINMAAVQEKIAPTCTHRGDFPIPMLEGSVYYTPMYYNSQASDSIISPQAICLNSSGYLTRWSQDGSTTSASGTITFFNKYGDAVIRLDLKEKNGLFYTETNTMALDHSNPSTQPTGNRAVFLHTEEGIEDEEASLDWDSLFSPAHANFHTRDTKSTPRQQQVEADLWQARLGHCGQWQLRVIPHAVEGTPSEFNPHPFASYEHY
jgi:hypothetical protein